MKETAVLMIQLLQERRGDGAELRTPVVIASIPSGPVGANAADKWINAGWRISEFRSEQNADVLIMERDEVAK